ncbi:hypothetical protein MPER_05642 [Moniliophthora perniciosa FA553]|nr:hypothetical protein MPER_05642 [Moniliophthora perniciosa FA553]
MNPVLSQRVGVQARQQLAEQHAGRGSRKIKTHHTGATAEGSGREGAGGVVVEIKLASAPHCVLSLHVEAGYWPSFTYFVFRDPDTALYLADVSPPLACVAEGPPARHSQ